MRIFKRGKTYYIDYTNAKGDRVKESTGTSNKKLAEQILAKRQTSVVEEKKLGIKPVTQTLLSDQINVYLDFSKMEKKPKSARIDAMALRNFSTIIGKNKQYIDEITEEDIEKFKMERAKTVSSSTVARELATVKHFFTKAERWGKTRVDPARKVKKPGQAPGRVRYLLKEEIKKLLDACTLAYLRLFVIIALNTGMRKGEILGLTWEDIDYENALIHLADSKSGERADIIMNSTVVNALKGYQDKPAARDEKIFKYEDIKKSFTGALQRAGIRNFRIHDLRHCFASHLAMNGTPLPTLMELMRHKTIHMTLRYAHLSPSHKRQEVENLAQIWPT